MKLDGNGLIVLLAGVGCVMYALYVMAEEQTVDFSDYFAEYDYGSLAMLDMESGRWTRHDPSLCAKRFSPASTFKIYNSLIGLETGVLDGPNTFIAWDGKKHSREELNRDHTLRSAVRNSVVWYFEEVARRVGPQRMARYIEAMDYGNSDISAWTTPFWLGGSLEISADEQVEMLRRLLRGELPFAQRHVETIIGILDHSYGGSSGLHGKTGSVILPTGARLGWFVGWVQRGGHTRIFAINVLGGHGASGMKARETMLSILRDDGLLPEG